MGCGFPDTCISWVTVKKMNHINYSPVGVCVSIRPTCLLTATRWCSVFLFLPRQVGCPQPGGPTVIGELSGISFHQQDGSCILISYLRCGVLVYSDPEGEQLSEWTVGWEETRVGREKIEWQPVSCIFLNPSSTGLVQADHMTVSLVKPSTSYAKEAKIIFAFTTGIN